MKPTRIIKPPYDKLTAGRKWAIHVLCDNGKEYTLVELAEKIGLKTGHGLSQRISENGWDHPDILGEPKGSGRTISGRPTTHNQFQPGKWEGLSGKSRDINLIKVPDMGTWEAQQCK